MAAPTGMRHIDLLRFALVALSRQRFRAAMILLVVALGTGSVIVLTGLGEGARLYVAGEFASMGTDTIIVLPGRQETTGGMPPVMGVAPRDLTLEDADAVRQLPGVNAVAPLLMGVGTVSVGVLQRDGVVVGTRGDYFHIRKLVPTSGRVFPDYRDAALPPMAVLGPTMAAELFRDRSPLGEWLRIGDRRYRVVGVLGETRVAGMDLGDAVFIPINHAQSMYDTPALFRLMVQVRPGASRARIEQAVRELLTARHDGDEDFTVTSPGAMLKSLDAILGIMTLAVSGIAGISLLVAGILIMNVTLISVTQRTGEIGLLKALGAPAKTVKRIFLAEALLLAVAGGALGVLVGELLLAIGRQAWPSIPFTAPWTTVLAAMAVALLSGLLFALLPAGRAAKLDPVIALTRKAGD